MGSSHTCPNRAAAPDAGADPPSAAAAEAAAAPALAPLEKPTDAARGGGGSAPAPMSYRVATAPVLAATAEPPTVAASIFGRLATPLLTCFHVGAVEFDVMLPPAGRAIMETYRPPLAGSGRDAGGGVGCPHSWKASFQWSAIPHGAPWDICTWRPLTNYLTKSPGPATGTVTVKRNAASLTCCRSGSHGSRRPPSISNRCMRRMRTADGGDGRCVPYVIEGMGGGLASVENWAGSCSSAQMSGSGTARRQAEWMAETQFRTVDQQ